jgi:PST family polysaccharide transporter
MALSIGVGLLVARYLGPEQFGLLNFALAAVALAGPLAEMGLDAVARREFVRQPERSAAIAGTVMRLRLCGGGVAVCAIVCAALVLARSAEERLLLVVLSLTILQPAGMIAETWLQSRHEARHSVVPQWCALFLGAGARLLAIRLQAPLSVFAIISVIEIGVGILLVAMAARRLGLVELRFDAGLARLLVCEGWPWAVSGAAVMIYMRIDVLMLRTMVGDSAAGVYAAAVRLSELGYFVPVIVANSVQPSLLKVKDRDLGSYNTALQRYFRLSVLCAYAFALPIALLASPIISHAYGARFAEAGPILAVHAWAAVFVFLGVARSQYLVNAGLARFGLMCTLAGAVANVVLNLILIPRWGGMGAAVATVVSYAVAGWVTSFFTPGARWIGWMQTKSLFWPVTT